MTETGTEPNEAEAEAAPLRLAAGHKADESASAQVIACVCQLRTIGGRFFPRMRNPSV